MDVRQVRAFLAVARDLHFGRAAEWLHLTQPHLSRTIRALEDEVGVPLFSRTTRRVELTPAGAALVVHAQAIVTAADEGRAAMAAAHEGRSGRVRIAFAGPSAHSAIGGLARAVREQHPLIDLEFLPGRYGPTAVAAVLAGECDLALVRFPEPPQGVRSRRVARDHCVVVLPLTHPLAERPTVRIEDFRGQAFVAFPESYGSAVRATLTSSCQAAGFLPRIVQTAPDSWTCMALVAAGVGLHLTTGSAVEHLPVDGVHVREVADPLPAISVFLIWRQDDEAPALHRVLRTADDVLTGKAHPD